MKLSKVLFVIVLASVFLSACAVVGPAALGSPAVQVPVEVKLALNALVLIGVMYGLQLVFDYVHIDLRGLGAAIAAAVTEAAILQLQGFIDLVPVAFDPVVVIGLQVLLAILVFLGSVRLLSQRERAKGFLAPRK